MDVADQLSNCVQVPSAAYLADDRLNYGQILHNERFRSAWCWEYMVYRGMRYLVAEMWLFNTTFNNFEYAVDYAFFNSR